MVNKSTNLKTTAEVRMTYHSDPQVKNAANSLVITDKAVRSLADEIFKHLMDEGCQAKDIINVSSQLLGLVTTQITRSDD